MESRPKFSQLVEADTSWPQMNFQIATAPIQLLNRADLADPAKEGRLIAGGMKDRTSDNKNSQG